MQLEQEGYVTPKAGRSPYHTLLSDVNSDWQRADTVITISSIESRLARKDYFEYMYNTWNPIRNAVEMQESLAIDIKEYRATADEVRKQFDKIIEF
jgi:hypothetical protein